MTKDNEDALRCATDLAKAASAMGREVSRLVTENEAQAALLRQIALTAHCGGLESMSEAEALIAIRKLTLETFKGIGHLSESAIRQHFEAKP